MPNDAKHHASGLADAVARPRSLVTVGYHINGLSGKLVGIGVYFSKSV